MGGSSGGGAARLVASFGTRARPYSWAATSSSPTSSELFHHGRPEVGELDVAVGELDVDELLVAALGASMVLLAAEGASMVLT